MLRLGYAEADITPSNPVEMVGFYREDNISRGVLKELLAQVTVWETDEICCLITIDSIGLKKELADNLRDIVKKTLKTPVEKVMVCFSHCHSAPNADAVKEYYELVCIKVEEAAKVAVSRLHEVCVGYENAYVDIGVNRRHGNNVDKRAGILKVCNSSKENVTELLLIRLTAHCNVLKSDNYMISPDYSGEVREVFGARYKCPVMVIQGSAGNIAPKYFNSKETPVDARGEKYIRSENGLMDMAQEVFEQSVPIIEQIHLKREAEVKMYSKNTVLNAQVPDYETAKVIAQEAKTECGIDGLNWLEEVVRLRNCGIKVQEEKVEVQFLKIGEWCLCGVPYELMVEFATRSEQILQDKFFYLNGYTNGCLSYFPTEEEFDKGGYEVYWSMLIYYPYFNRVFPFERESATKLLDFIISNVPN